MPMVVLTFESIDEIVNCNHLKETYKEEISCVDVLKLYKVVLTFESVDEIPKCDQSDESYREALSSSVHFIMVYKGLLAFQSVDGLLKAVTL